MPDWGWRKGFNILPKIFVFFGTFVCVSIIFFIFVVDFSSFSACGDGLSAGLVPVAAHAGCREDGTGFRDIVKGRLPCTLS